MPRLLLALLLLLAPAGPAGAVVRAEPVHPDPFADPVQVVAAPDDPGRIYVVEQRGTIEVLEGGRRSTFLDQRDSTSFGGEQGLFSLAFPPDYAQTGRVYVDYTDPLGDIRVDELATSGPGRADPATRRNVLTIEHRDGQNHNGGQLEFGPDGLLYVGTGDGGGPGGYANGQSLSTLLGKILRIDPRGVGPGEYSIPADNPFAGVSGARPEIWSFGLRNPWRFSFDRATGDLYVADVGEHAWEEIDYAAAPGAGRGVNWGWACREGPDPSGFGVPCAPDPVAPVVSRSHGDGFCAIAGGSVVRDPGLPTLYGRYLYGDFCRSTLDSVAIVDGRATAAREEEIPIASVVGFGEDACGRVHVTSLAGTVYRLQDGEPTPCAPQPLTQAQPAADTTPPVLTLHRSARQRTRVGRALLSVRCAEHCELSFSGALRIEGRRRPLPAARVTRSGAAETWHTVGVRPARRAARAVRRALAAGRRVRAALMVVATDAAGNRSEAHRRVQLERPTPKPRRSR